MNDVTLILEVINQHIAEDRTKFEGINSQLGVIGTDVKSLLITRSFAVGLGRAGYAIIGILSTGFGAVAASLVAWYLRH